MMRATTYSLCVVLGLVLGSCGPDGTSSGEPVEDAPTEAVVKVEQGIAFGTGTLVTKFTEADLMVTINGPDGPRAATGGAKSTVNEPANWFIQGGVPRVFTSLAQVPKQKPQDGDPGILLHVKTGNGFMIKNFVSGAYTRGWVRSADETQVTIEYELVD